MSQHNFTKLNLLLPASAERRRKEENTRKRNKEEEKREAKKPDMPTNTQTPHVE